MAIWVISPHKSGSLGPTSSLRKLRHFGTRFPAVFLVPNLVLTAPHVFLRYRQAQDKLNLLLSELVQINNFDSLDCGINGTFKSCYVKTIVQSTCWGHQEGAGAQIFGITKLRWHTVPDPHLILLLIIFWNSSTNDFRQKMGNELASEA